MNSAPVSPLMKARNSEGTGMLRLNNPIEPHISIAVISMM